MNDIPIQQLARLSTLETHLKYYYRLREDLHGQILSSQELSDYFLWMAGHPHTSAHNSSLFSTPRILKDTDIGAWSQKLLNNPSDEKTFSLLSENFQTASEIHLFPPCQDLSVGQEIRYMPPYWHSHSFFEVYYSFCGSCDLIFSEETLTLAPGTVVIVPPLTRKACSCLSDDCVAFCYMLRSSTFSNVFFELLSSENIMSLFFSHALLQKNNTCYLKFDTGRDPDICHLLFAVYEQCNSSHTYRPQMLNSLMRTFFLLLLQRFERTAALSENSSFHWKSEFTSILQYIQEHFAAVTIDDLAKKYHYSPRQIIRIIQNCTGKPFHQLIQQLRMEKAASLLRSSELSIRDISSLSGYSGLSSFYRAFQNYYGTSPGSYRKKL